MTPRIARPMRRVQYLLRVFAVLSTGCGGGGDAGPGTTAPTAPVVDNTPASITLSATAAFTLQSGASSTLTATVLTKDGRAVSPTIAWTTSDAGIASVSGGTITALKVGSTTISASAGPATASVIVTVTPGAAAVLALRAQPAGAAIGSMLTTQPVVEVRDANGNVVIASSAPVTVAITSGGGTLGGTTTVNAVSGVATFSLSIAGSAGARILSFSSPGLASATSAELTMTPPPIPLIVLDSPSVTLTKLRGAGPSTVRIRITNGGAAPLTGLAVEGIAYDAGQPTGWLGAALDSAAAPTAITLTATISTLTDGNYRAVVRITAPGASNSPLTVPVTLTVLKPTPVTYGTSSDKVKIIDIGATYTPVTSVVDFFGQPLAGVPLTYTSRASSVASVGADGRITARSAGEAWIVVNTAVSTDSVFVIVPRSADGPLVRTNVTTWLSRTNDTIFVTVFLDTRSTTVGSASLVVDVDIPGVGYSYSAPATSPTAVVNFTTSGVLRISVAAATGMTGAIPVLTLKLLGRNAGTTGWLRLYGIDVSGIDGRDLTAQTTSTRLPIVIR